MSRPLSTHLMTSFQLLSRRKVVSAKLGLATHSYRCGEIIVHAFNRKHQSDSCGRIFLGHSFKFACRVYHIPPMCQTLCQFSPYDRSLTVAQRRIDTAPRSSRPEA
ncbi:hypothetical protein PAXRUDRAFT_800610 [Paxillus rubicundulus Ve08.2h10]|uniref:Uncharacterized protein n=1 Tax=Paxillus rubicundulus Ve08.2h10 TaxID=930991 RepID=A0A0D0DIA3_9AGAM|nr:hypothetical protein PAXRUDRAFT_800610 [Paxillus rubicundulus Ve08.2h10]